jgi:hypothetical protein
MYADTTLGPREHEELWQMLLLPLLQTAVGRRSAGTERDIWNA